MQNISKLIISTLCLTAFIFSSQRIVIDRDFSPYMGAPDLYFLESSLMRAEDTLWNPSDPKSEATVWGRALGSIFAWYPINMTAVVAQHEVFGHGYRLRELGIHPKKYKVTPFGGLTSFDVPSNLPVGELLAITVAGLEADAIFGEKLKMGFIEAQKLDGRLSMLYIGSQQSLLTYIIVTNRGRLSVNGPSAGNDIEAYLDLMNSTYPNDKISLGKLTRWSLISFLDPMSWFAYFSWFYYIANGCAWDFPMIPISESVQYLPNFRVGLAPFAPEFYLENYFRIKGAPLYSYIKGSRRSFGFGAAYEDLFRFGRGNFGFRIDGWRQHQYITSAVFRDLIEERPIPRRALNTIVWGGAFSLTNKITMGKNTSLFIELGGKTPGYLPGYALGSSLTVRVGLVFGGLSK